MSACGWSSEDVPEASSSNRGVDETDRGHRARRGVREEVGEGMGDTHVLRAPQGQERDVGVVVLPAQSGGGQPVPDGGHRGGRGGVVDPVGLRGVQVEPVGVGLGHHRGEVAVAHRPGRRGLPEKGEVRLLVVADRQEIVLARPQPPVRGSGVQLDPAALIGVVGVMVTATGGLGEVVGRPGDAVAVDEAQSLLLAIGTRQPPHEVIKGSVLHHHHHDVIDPGRARGGQRRACGRRRRLPEKGSTDGGRAAYHRRGPQ